MATARQVLPALERISKQPDRPGEPIDRHLAAFLIVRDKRSEMLFASMAPTETPIRRGLAMLTLFSEMQYRYGPDQLPGLAGWLYPHIETSIKRFLSKPFQEKVLRQAKAAVAKGDLAKLMQLVDDPKRIEHDEREFIMARRMYLDVQAEIASLEAELNHRDKIVHSVGRPVAASIATLLAILLLAVAIGRAMLQSLI